MRLIEHIETVGTQALCTRKWYRMYCQTIFTWCKQVIAFCT